MSPKMLIYAGVNLHQWAQPRAKRTPAEWSLSWADERSGVGWGATSHLSFPPPSSPLPLWSLGLNCWLPRRSIGTAGVIESLLRRAGLRSTGSERCTHICTQMRLMFLLSGMDKAWNICPHEVHECPEEYWVGVLPGMILNYLCYWPMWSLFLLELLHVCARVYVLGGNARPKLMNCAV